MGISEIPKDEIEKARLLARCLQQQPCLLILDGLEPLQYSQNLAAMNGELQDSALKEFIACFRRTAGKSFVLFSSRQPLVELKKWQSDNFLSLDLKTLPNHDGEKLLESLGVIGNKNELRTISQDLNGHALSLVLMGHLLTEHHQGDCRYANELPPLTSAHGDSNAEKDSHHALRVLDYYDSLQDAASRCFLQLLGLFYRPMNAAEKAVLIANSNHAEPLRALTEKQWHMVELQLEESAVLLGKKGQFTRLEWDSHPIIRSYFGQKFKENFHEGFKQANKVLFNFYQKIPEKEFPNTLDEIQPLYRSVMHGCLAEDYLQAFEIYWKRICRNNSEDSDAYYSLYNLGAYSQDLTVLMAFLPSGWRQIPEKGLIRDYYAELLGIAAFCLMSLGRLKDAIEPSIASIELFANVEDWKNAAITTQNLVDLSLSLGHLEQAHITAQQAIEYAEKSNDIYQQIRGESYLATVLHRKGNLSESHKHFKLAEALEPQRGRSYLTAQSGFWYCTLLLDSSRDENTLQDITTRSESCLKFQIKNNHLIGIAQDHLILANTYFASGKFMQSETNMQYKKCRKQKQPIIILNSTSPLPTFTSPKNNYYKFKPI